ncbi:MAG TPA: MarR family transcriptional regulator [Sphingobium sp.]|nr:MarR family transcriptional regulator [Sphingobium sp.]
MTGRKMPVPGETGRDPIDSSPLVNSRAWFESPNDAVRRDPVALNKFLFVRRLIQVSRLWRQFLRLALREGAASQNGWQTLFWLSLSGPADNQRQLADRIGVKESTIARALDALEQQGLVERKASPRDRRVKSVAMTAAAEPAIAEINDKARTLRDRLLANIAAEDLAVAVRVLGQIAETMAAVDAEPPHETP